MIVYLNNGVVDDDSENWLLFCSYWPIFDGDDDNVEKGDATEVDNNNDDQPAIKFL